PAHRAILPMITNVEDRTAVNSLLDSVTRGATVLGPIVSVTLLHTIGIRHFFTFDAVTYLLSAFLIYKIQINDVNHNTVKELANCYLCYGFFEYVGMASRFITPT